jgi:hypothetical protein
MAACASRHQLVHSLEPAGDRAGRLDLEGRLSLRENGMGFSRTILRVGGIVAVVIGLVWIGQGTGYFPYPARSFMINQMPWVYWGAALAVLGFLAVILSRRR